MSFEEIVLAHRLLRLNKPLKTEWALDQSDLNSKMLNFPNVDLFARCFNHKLPLYVWKKCKRKVQGVPQSQTAALPRPQEEEETDKSKQAQTEQTLTKSTKISFLFPKRGNRNTKRTKKHKNKMTHRTTYNKSPRWINHKATKSKTNTGTTALERSVEQTTGVFKVLLQLANFTLGPDATLNTETHKNSVRRKAPS